MRLSIAALLIGSVVGCSSQPVETAKSPAVAASVYTVDVYDPARNPNFDLNATTDRAKEEGKNVILIVGGDW